MKQIMKDMLESVDTLSQAIAMKSSMTKFIDKWEEYHFENFSGKMTSFDVFLTSYRYFTIAIDGPFSKHKSALFQLRAKIAATLENESRFLDNIRLAITMEMTTVPWKFIFNIARDDFQSILTKAIEQFDEIEAYNSPENQKKYLKLPEDDHHILISKERNRWEYSVKDGDTVILKNIDFIDFSVTSSTMHYHKTDKEMFKRKDIAKFFPEMVL